MRVLNLEQGRPDRLTARRLLLSGLENARASGHREVKLIHGYGSHGVGGSIRRDTRTTLLQLRRRDRSSDLSLGRNSDPSRSSAGRLSRKTGS